MKFVFLLLLASCAGMNEGKYKKEFFQGDYYSKEVPEEIHNQLTKKMTKCYPQSEYPAFEKTISAFNGEKQYGTISYQVDNQSIGPKILVLVEIYQDVKGSLIRVYSRGDLFRPAGVFKHQIQKWIDGKVVDCHAQGKI